MPAWVTDGVQTYTKRLPRHVQLEFREFAAAQRATGISADKLRAKEGDLLLKAVPPDAHVVALDEHGDSWSSTQLASQLEGWLANQPKVFFMIGGADGLSAECKQRANRLWSLSALTLPHALVRVVLAEQLYRAWTLTQGHPYHRQ